MFRQFNDTLAIREVNITERYTVRISLLVVFVTTLLMIQSIQGDLGGKMTISVMARRNFNRKTCLILNGYQDRGVSVFRLNLLTYLLHGAESFLRS